MAIKDILLHLDTSGRGDAATAFAVSLASTLQAHLTVAGVAMQIVPPTSFMGDYPYDLMVEATTAAQKAAEDAYAKLRAAAPTGVATELVTITAPSGEARNEFGRLGRHFDLIVVGQGGPEYGTDDELMGEGALFRSGRPVFVVPRIHQGAAKLGKAMVCWDGGLAGARAVGDALPLLTRAGRVEIVSVEPKKPPVDDASGLAIARHLARHNINATLRKLPPSNDIGAALLSHAADGAADYLVMGGYGHSRFREFVLGGTTRTLFEAMTVPVLMSH